MRTKGDGIAAARDAIASYESQIHELEAELASVQQDERTIREEMGETIENLATGLLPSHEPEVVEAAAEETGALHLRSRLEDLARQLDDSKARIAAIDADQRYVDRDVLVHPTTGDYSQRIASEIQAVEAFETRLADFECREFQWLYRRGFHEKRESNAFQKFWRVVTLANHREERALAVVEKRFEKSDFSALAREYDDVCEKLAYHTKELEGWEAKRDEVLDLIAEREELSAWIDDYPRQCVAALRIDLASHLANCEFGTIHARVRPAGKILAAKSHALTKKLEYLSDLERYLRREIEDRRARIASIDNVRRKWSRKPYGFLRGDKTKWLVTVPEMKRQGTRKRVVWARGMHHNIHSYDSYDSYSVYLDTGVAFLAYDAFAHAAEERMPYEGFSRTVIDELDEFRVEHDMERPDYAMFDEWEDEAAADAEGEMETGDAGEMEGDFAEGVAAAALAAEADALADDLVDES